MGDGQQLGGCCWVYDEIEWGISCISKQVLSALKSQYQVFFHEKEENEIFFGKIENIEMSVGKC